MTEESNPLEIEDEIELAIHDYTDAIGCSIKIKDATLIQWDHEDPPCA